MQHGVVMSLLCQRSLTPEETVAACTHLTARTQTPVGGASRMATSGEVTVFIVGLGIPCDVELAPTFAKLLKHIGGATRRC